MFNGLLQSAYTALFWPMTGADRPDDRFEAKENQARLLNVLADKKTERAYRDYIWSIRDREQKSANHFSRKKYDLPRATKEWKAKTMGAVRAKPPVGIDIPTIARPAPFLESIEGKGELIKFKK